MKPCITRGSYTAPTVTLRLAKRGFKHQIISILCKQHQGNGPLKHKGWNTSCDSWIKECWQLLSYKVLYDKKVSVQFTNGTLLYTEDVVIQLWQIKNIRTPGRDPKLKIHKYTVPFYSYTVFHLYLYLFGSAYQLQRLWKQMALPIIFVF